MSRVRLLLALMASMSCGSKPFYSALHFSTEGPRRTGILRAGFGKVDITPPPGVGLGGNGPEGKRANGYRTRLYARAMVLEDPDGQRLAFVLADLPHGSAILHREVAESTHHYGMGSDRLIVAVSHTHSGPNHYLDAANYNKFASAVGGFDPFLLDSLRERIVSAVKMAVDSLRPARMAWGAFPVWRATRIRSFPAFSRNTPPRGGLAPAPDDLESPAYAMVDPYLTMLRVDREDSRGQFRPAGAFTVFAVHGTGNTTATTLLDGDIHELVARQLERHIDRDLNGENGFQLVHRATHLFANGNQGDVSPAWTPQSRCRTPRLAPEEVFDGRETRPQWGWREPDSAHIQRCVGAARNDVQAVADLITEGAIHLFDSLGSTLGTDVSLARAFVAISMRESWKSLRVCEHPSTGLGTYAGGEDAPTRMDGWRVFGVVNIGLTLGESFPSTNPDGCHAEKRVLLGEFGTRLQGGDLPDKVQVTVVRVGDALIAALPVEVTTTAGRRIRSAMLEAARQKNLPVKSALIVGLANGYFEYLATPEEYTAQLYEGASTLYGPNEAAMFQGITTGLVHALADGTSPVGSSDSTFSPGDTTRILPKLKGPTLPSVIESSRCSGDTLYVRFRGPRLGEWPTPKDPRNPSPRLLILRETGSTRDTLAWDDDPHMELHLVNRKDRPTWEARWSRASKAAYVVRTGDGKEEEVTCK